jgi:hypothetical protein
MIPALSKRPFGHPVPAAAVAHFLHPSHPVFRHAYRHPQDGNLYAAAILAIRLRPSYAIDPAEYPEAPSEFTDRLANLPWSRFPAAAKFPATWRPLDDHRGTIYADPLASFWEPDRTGRSRFHAGKTVRICGAPIVPLAVLQLLARLPRPEICTGGCTLTGPVLFRFTGGEGIIPHLGLTSGAAFEFLRPRDTSFDLEAFTF